MPSTSKGSACLPQQASFLEQLPILGCSDTFSLPLLSAPQGMSIGLQCQCSYELLMRWCMLCGCCSHSLCCGLRDSDGDKDGNGRFYLSPFTQSPDCPEQEVPDGAQHGHSLSFGPIKSYAVAA